MRRTLLLLMSFSVPLLAAPAVAADVPKVGDTVWAQWRPNDWYHGKIDKAGTVGLHVAFDDGDEADLPRSVMAVDREPKAANVKVGARVLGKWTDGKWYPGIVSQVGDGKYDIVFDDSDKATVALADVRLMAVQPAAARTAKVGDTVWAQWRPNAWYHGKIDKAGTVGLHVAFDDGDEADLPATIIALDQAPKRAGVKVGTRVLALWSDQHFYPGTVAKAGDGTYDIQFDDGDRGSAALADLRLLNE